MKRIYIPKACRGEITMCGFLQDRGDHDFCWAYGKSWEGEGHGKKPVWCKAKAVVVEEEGD